MQFPADPDGTLDRVVGSGELTVGVSLQPPFTTLTEEGADPGGSEVELVTGFAQSLGAEPTFVVGGEQELVRQLEEGEIDVLVGGLTADSPWSSKVALTRPYATAQEHGKKAEHVLAAVPGENALLSRLERYLDEVAP